MTGGTHLDVHAVLPCNTHQYYVERDSAAFRALLAKALNLGVYKFRDTWQEGGSTFVRLVTKPEISSWVPSAVRNAVANASEIEFHDIIEYNPNDTSGPSYTLHVRTESPFLGDKLKVNTTLELTPLTTDTTLQRLSGTVCVRMFGMGGLIEKAIRENMVKTYHQLPEIISRWEAYRTEVMKNGDAGVLLAGRPPVGGDIEYVRSIMQAPFLKQMANQTTPILPSVDGDGGVENLKPLLEETARTKVPLAETTTTTATTINKTPADAGAAGMPLRHARRRTASELILDALPLLDNKDLSSSEEQDGPNATLTATNIQQLTTAAALPRHWRGFSWDSVGSQSSDAPTELEERTPGSKGAYTAWRRFNRDYAVWETYWAQIGVHAATAAHQGVVRIFDCVMAELAALVRLFAIVLLLLLVRMNVLRVDSSRTTTGRRGNIDQNRSISEPKDQQQRNNMKRRNSSRLGRTSSLVETAEATTEAMIPEKLGNGGGGGGLVEQLLVKDVGATTTTRAASDDNIMAANVHSSQELELRRRSSSSPRRWFSLKRSATL